MDSNLLSTDHESVMLTIYTRRHSNINFKKFYIVYWSICYSILILSSSFLDLFYEYNLVYIYLSIRISSLYRLIYVWYGFFLNNKFTCPRGYFNSLYIIYNILCHLCQFLFYARFRLVLLVLVLVYRCV